MKTSHAPGWAVVFAFLLACSSPLTAADFKTEIDSPWLLGEWKEAGKPAWMVFRPGFELLIREEVRGRMQEVKVAYSAPGSKSDPDQARLSFWSAATGSVSAVVQRNPDRTITVTVTRGRGNKAPLVYERTGETGTETLPELAGYRRVFGQSPEGVVKASRKAASLETCAKACAQQKDFQCTGFVYVRNQAECWQTDQPPGAIKYIDKPRHVFYLVGGSGTAGQAPPVQAGMPARPAAPPPRAPEPPALVTRSVRKAPPPAVSDVALGRFRHTPDAAISGHNNRHIKGASPADCARACLNEREFRCRSFDYYKRDRACDLSDKHASEVGGLKRDYGGNPYDHYSLGAPVVAAPAPPRVAPPVSPAKPARPAPPPARVVKSDPVPAPVKVPPPRPAPVQLSRPSAPRLDIAGRYKTRDGGYLDLQDQRGRISGKWDNGSTIVDARLDGYRLHGTYRYRPDTPIATFDFTFDADGRCYKGKWADNGYEGVEEACREEQAPLDVVGRYRNGDGDILTLRMQRGRISGTWSNGPVMIDVRLDGHRLHGTYRYRPDTPIATFDFTFDADGRCYQGTWEDNGHSGEERACRIEDSPLQVAGRYRNTDGDYLELREDRGRISGKWSNGPVMLEARLDGLRLHGTYRYRPDTPVATFDFRFTPDGECYEGTWRDAGVSGTEKGCRAR